MKDQNLELFNNGDFKPVDELPMDEISDCMTRLAALQEKCGKFDMNSFLNMYHDGMTGKILGFDRVNVGKHGIDCKSAAPLYLEVKSIGWNGGPMNKLFAAFNDIGQDKVDVMKDKKAWLACGIWFNINDLGFILFGQNKEIGDLLEKKMLENKAGQRCCALIPLTSLITKYGFKIIAVSKSKEEIKDLLIEANPMAYKDIDLDRRLINICDFELAKQSPYINRILLEHGLVKNTSDDIMDYLLETA
jgi:hypothetical protein